MKKNERILVSEGVRNKYGDAFDEVETFKDANTLVKKLADESLSVGKSIDGKILIKEVLHD